MLGKTNFTGKNVVVSAGGVTYRGRLVEMTESSILLKMESGFIEIPMDSVHELKSDSADPTPTLPPSPLRAAKKGA